MLCNVYAQYTSTHIYRVHSVIRTYELIFGKKSNIPTAFLKEPEPQYNNENYAIDLKRIMQKSQKVGSAK